MEQSKDNTATISYLSLIESFDDFPHGPLPSTYYQLYLPHDQEPHGYLLPETVQKMPWTSRFSVHHENPRHVSLLDSSDGKDTAAAVNAAFAEIVNLCIDRNLFGVLDGRHSEPITIVSARYATPVFIERFAASLFGLTTKGAHLIAYSRTDEGMKIWIPRRSAKLYTYPGMLDTTVAGGIKAGATPFQTIVEEAYEEASLSEDLIRRDARSRGALSHMSVTGKGFFGEQGLVLPDYIYVYDIELSQDVVPKPYDDEVDSFSRMSVNDVQSALLRGEFKPDSAAVLIDLLITHGVITAENEKEYVEISMRLHRKLPFRAGSV